MQLTRYLSLRTFTHTIICFGVIGLAACGGGGGSKGIGVSSSSADSVTNSSSSVVTPSSLSSAAISSVSNTSSSVTASTIAISSSSSNSITASSSAANNSSMATSSSVASVVSGDTPIDNLPVGQWLEIPNSRIDSVAPNPLPINASGFRGLFAWSGGAYDTKRDRFIVWGGGHEDYSGNEIYAFDVNTLQWTRVNNPSSDVGGSEASGYYPDGTPRSRHTYGSLQYLASIDRFCAFGASALYPSGQLSTKHTDCFNFDSLSWEQKADVVHPGYSKSAYDTLTGHTWFLGAGGGGSDALYEFDPIANSWTKRVNSDQQLDFEYYLTAAIDPVTHKLVMVGHGKTYLWDISNPASTSRITLSVSGDTAIQNAQSPGFEYDPVTAKFIAYNGGADVYELTITGATTAVWTRRSPAQGNTVIPTSAHGTGTYGRFRYIPSKNAFIVLNDTDENVYVYRLSANTGSGSSVAASSATSSLASSMEVQSSSPSSSSPNNGGASSVASVVNGACGSANGTTLNSAPTSNFCAVGVVSAVTGLGPWSWSCAGAQGGVNASCIAHVSSDTPPTGNQVTSLQFSTPSAGLVPFTVGLGFKKGDVTGYPTLDIANQQVVVMRRWNDGSVKHAIASGHINLAANTLQTVGVINSAAAPSGTNLVSDNIKIAAPQASVALGAYGTVNLSSLLDSPYRTWISGPEMVEAHYRSVVGSDATLVVWFHVRYYKNGRLWIRTSVDNGYLDISTVDKTYTPSVVIGGTTVYGGSSLTHYAHTRWAVEGWIGGDPQITPKHDTAYLKASKLVPNYMANTPSATALNSLYQTYAPNQIGNFEADMSQTGFQQGIGILPIWDALYITSGADSRAYKSVLAHGKAITSYPIVWNDSLTNISILPSERAAWTVSGPNQGGETALSVGGHTWDVAHHPSAGYLAYLITGDYYYLEVMEDQATTCYLMASSARYNALGNQVNNHGTDRHLNGQTRGYAWGIRTLSQYAGLAPDNDEVATDYRALLAGNIAHLLALKNSVSPAGIGYIYEYNASAYAPGVVAPWQQSFFIQSLGMGADVEPLSNMSDYLQVRDYMYRGVVGILGDSNGYCFNAAGEYKIKTNNDTGSQPNSWYKTWAEVYQATFMSDPTCTNSLTGTSGGDPLNAPTGYWGNLLPAIAYAVDHGAPGATEAWGRLTGANNWSAVQNSGFDDIPVWGVIPR